MGLKLTSQEPKSKLHYLWSADLSKSFSQLIVSICFFSIYFPIAFARWKSVGWVCKYVCVCVLCVCVFILFHYKGFFRLQDVWGILEGYRSTILCCVPSSFISISKNVIFYLQRRNSSTPTTGEKTICYIAWRKDDIYWFRI